MPDIIHKIGIKAPLMKVYNALSTIEGVAGWWTEETTGKSEVGGNIAFCFRSPDGKVIGEMGMNVLGLVPNQRVHWLVKTGPDEWVGSDITFDLTQDGDMTIVIFGHRNWREASEFMAHCSMKWATFLLSLRQLIETGKGKPAPHDLKIDNWN